MKIRKLRIKAFVRLVLELFIMVFFLILIFLVSETRWFYGVPLFLAGIFIIIFWWIKEEKPARILRREILEKKYRGSA